MYQRLNKLIYGLIIISSVFTSVALAQLLDIPRTVFSNSGQKFSSSDNSTTIIGTIGQTIAGLTANSTYTVGEGFLHTTPDSGVTIFVDADASGNNNGTNWADAFTNLQVALNSAGTGDEIWVAHGNVAYKPGSTRESTFNLSNGVALFGGFNGTETKRSQRDWIGNETILSGDLLGDDGANFINYNDNTAHVVTSVNNDSTAMIDGFTIMSGNASGTFGGGGIRISSSSPIIKNCIFKKNLSNFGGAIEVISANSTPVISNCTFSENRATEDGGGIHIFRENPTVENCVFLKNSAGRGGGILTFQSAAKIVNCLFIENSALKGGAVTHVETNTVITNCTFALNTDSGGGGGIFTDFSSLNQAFIKNCIIWGNNPSSGGGEISSIDAGKLPRISSSNIKNSNGTGASWDNSIGIDDGGNIDADPLFIDSSNPAGSDQLFGTIDDGLRLQRGSPSLDSGAMDDVAVTDIIGFLRPLGPEWDMGAYELNPFGLVNELLPKISDLEDSLMENVNNGDLFGSAVTSIGDLNRDGNVDIAVGAIGDDGSGGGVNQGAVYILFLDENGGVQSHQKINNTEGGLGSVLSNGDLFGSSIISLGDLDGDYVSDIAVGASGYPGGAAAGAVWILFMNEDGTVKQSQKITSVDGGFTGNLDSNDKFGTSIANLGDLNNDGVIDIAVGAIGDDGNSTGETADDFGAVLVLYLNADGTVNGHSKISNDGAGFDGELDGQDEFGQSLTSIGDLNGDGIVDIAVGSWKDDDRGIDQGAVYLLFLSSDSTVKSHKKISASTTVFLKGLQAMDYFGSSLTSLPDLDGNGYVDLAVGALGDDNGGSGNNADRGAVWILSLDTSGTVEVFQKISGTGGDFSGDLDNGDNFGAALSHIEDLDGNGSPKLAIGAPGDDDGGLDRGAVWINKLNAVAFASLGDFAWLDINENGLQDSGEPGVNGVAVQLFQPGINAVVGGGDDFLTKSTITKESGLFSFNHLSAGDYFIRVPEPFLISVSDQGSNDQIDNDIDPMTKSTELLSLAPGEENNDTDIGLKQPETGFLLTVNSIPFGGINITGNSVLLSGSTNYAAFLDGNVDMTLNAPSTAGNLNNGFVSWVLNDSELINDQTLNRTLNHNTEIIVIYENQWFFEPGWNLISIPVSPDAATLNILNSQLHPPFWLWDGKKFIVADDLDAGSGYWVYSSGAFSIKPEGAVLNNGIIPTLHAGWNLVGVNGHKPVNTSDLSDPKSVIWTWDAAQQQFLTVHDLSLQSFEIGKLLPGKGYWIFK